MHLRVDDDQPFSIEAPGWSGPIAANIIARMREATRIRIRYTAFAGRRVIDADISPDGFGQALDWAIQEAGSSSK